MITALCLHPCLDKSARVDRFDPDAPNRVTVERLDVGGKGVNVARAACALGAKTRLVGLDDAEGTVARAMAGEGIACRLAPAAGRLRVNLKLRDVSRNRTIEINEQGSPVEDAVLAAAEEALLSCLRPGDWVTLSGSLPPGADPGWYGAVCEKIQAAGCHAAVDCDGTALQMALPAAPALIKPNAQEFSLLTGAPPADDAAAVSACRKLLDRGVGRVCLSRGDAGALLVTPEGAWRCPAAQVPVRGTQGAGDTLLAALLTAFGRGARPWEALRFASAAAGASVLRPGTLLCRREDVEALLPGLSAVALG